MTEPRIADLCTVIQAARLDLLRIAGRLAERSAEMLEEQAGPKVARWAAETELDAVAIAAGARALSERTDELLEDTQLMDVASFATPEPDDDPA